MLTALIFIGVIGVLVLVHEWGHFIMARRAGMKVEEFGFGFPPRLFGIKRGETIFSINWIPFGGFVKILGEDGGQRDNPGSFGSKSISARLMVIVAGVVMNLLFAAVLLSFNNFFSLRIGLFNEEMINQARDKKVQILEVVSGSPAEKSDLRTLDEIVGISLENGDILPISTIEEIQEFTREHKGEKISLVIKDGDKTVIKAVESRSNPPACEGSMGISMALTGVVSYPWYEAIWRGAYDTANLTYGTMQGFYMLINPPDIECPPSSNVAGPIGIASITGQAARVGFSYLMQFVALISVNLAVLNIMPFPALDGGRAVFIVAEKLRGKPLNKRIEATVNGIGFALLIGLMIYVTIKDVAKFFTV